MIASRYTYRHAIGHPGGAFDAILKAGEALEALRENGGKTLDALSEIAISLGASDSLDLIQMLKRSSTGDPKNATLRAIFSIFMLEAAFPELDCLKAFYVLKAHEIVYGAACR